MKHSFLKINAVLLVLLLCVFGTAFAKGNSEKAASGTAKTEKAADKKNNNKAISAYEQEIKDFEKKYEELVAKVELAYDKNDAVAYKEAKNELRNLEYPRLTKEKSEEIENTLKDDDFESANWLYVNSRFYHPSLRLESSRENFRYSSSMTANPGSDITLPQIKGPSGALLFEGWGLTEDKVTYKAGDVIKMPVKDLVLYAVFSVNPDIKEGKNLEISNYMVLGNDGLVLTSGKQMNFAFKIKNNGTENLHNLDIKFDSDDPLFVILTDTLHCHFLQSADDGTARFKVITKAGAGTQLKGTVTVTDAEGSVWTEDLTFTVR